MDCVVSYHMNPATCGVAKFNLVLARHIGVPVLSIFDDAVFGFQQPLISIKAAELTAAEQAAVKPRVQRLSRRASPRVFLHEYTDTVLEQSLVREASVVYGGNAEVVAKIASARPDALELWCPGTILDHDRFHPVDVSVLSFGMAHKVRSDYYGRLHELLEASGRTYALYLSTALHERTSFEESFNGAFDSIRSIFGGKVYFLGFLSDAAVYNYMLDCTYFVAFFDRGVRSNNTSVNAALACGTVVITNLDRFSPPILEHGTNILDIEQLDHLTTEAAVLDAMGARARETATGRLGWVQLVARISSAEAGANGLVHAETAISRNPGGA
jgi:hypothetical protein